MNTLKTNEPIRKRFWKKVIILGCDECWIWTSSRHRQGYGTFSINNECNLAHRVAFELRFGKISDGLDVLHSCDNPPCVNPYHLFLGTHNDNMRDMIKKGRWKNHWEDITSL